MPRPRRLPLLTLLVVLPLAAVVPAQGSAQTAALEPPSSGGLVAVDRALANLAVHRRLLLIAAHPDDESNDLLTWTTLGSGGDAAYLALSRGEGGQNLIGTELGTGLGVIRTGELLAARGVDGARQFFTRAYDFGYTRSLEETFERWPREALLEDAVRVIRRFKPQVIVATFPPDERAGHGQHQASAVIAEEAFRLAGQPDAFAHLERDEGLVPWAPSAFYRLSWWNREATTHRLPLGELDPLSGRSLHQIAMRSRSQHRSQDMGMLEPIGPRDSGLIRVIGPEDTASGDDLFVGVDTRLAGLADLVAGSDRHAEVEARLAEAETTARRLRERLSPRRLADATPPLAYLLDQLRRARGAVASADAVEAGRAHALALLDEKIARAQEALVAASGMVTDARADAEAVVAGQTIAVELSLWSAGGAATGAAPRARLASTTGWLAAPTGVALERDEKGVWTGRAELRLADALAPTVPYFLARPRVGDLYDWSEVAAGVRGEPAAPAPLLARFELELAGQPVTIEREVVYRYRDQAIGEVRRPLRALPAVEVSVSPRLIVWPTRDRAAKTVEVAVTAHRAGRVRLGLVAADGWPMPEPIDLDFAQPAGGREVVRLALPPPPGERTGRLALEAVARFDGRDYQRAFPVIDYPHIRPVPLPESARVEVTVADIELPPVSRVGYVRGASDRVPELLAAVGLPVEVLGPQEIENADLADYEVLVIGSRAYETEPALRRANRRLLDWLSAGGRLVVQYQQYQFVQGGYAPVALEIARPHDRVTDETAPVRLLDAGHPVFCHPNRIEEADWEGWVQERGLYFANSWDAALVPLLALADPGGPELEGGLLVGRVGRGTYVYTGLAFFRQLPAGVPGAYRLLVNLLSPPDAETSPQARSETETDPAKNAAGARP